MQIVTQTYLIVGLKLMSGSAMLGRLVSGLTETVLPEPAWLPFPAELPLPLPFCCYVRFNVLPNVLCCRLTPAELPFPFPLPLPLAMSLKELPVPALGLVIEPKVLVMPERKSREPASRSFRPRPLREGKVTVLPLPAWFLFPASLWLPLLLPASLWLPFSFCKVISYDNNGSSSGLTYAVVVGNALKLVVVASTGVGDGANDVAQLRSGS
jgi:hypothetical protein